MKRTLRLPVAIVLICVFLIASSRPAKASIPTGSQVVLIFVGVAAIGAAIGVGVYYAVRQPPSITGCAVAAPNGLSLQNEGDQQTFNLVGDTATFKAGDRIRVKGKKKKKDASGNRTFLVEKLSKDFGPCKVPSTSP